MGPYPHDVVVNEGRTLKLPLQLKKPNGRPYDLTSNTSVTLSLMRVNQWSGEQFDWTTADLDPSGNTLKVTDAACVVVTAAKGRITWQPGATDLDTPGRYWAQCKVTFSGGYEIVPALLDDLVIYVAPALRFT